MAARSSRQAGKGPVENREGTSQGEPEVEWSGAALYAYGVMFRYAQLSRSLGKEKRRKTTHVQTNEIPARSGRLNRVVRCSPFRCSTLHVPWGNRESLSVPNGAAENAKDGSDMESMTYARDTGH